MHKIITKSNIDRIIFISQAVCKERIVLKVEFFAKGYGAGEDPRRACILAYFIGVCFILMGKDNCSIHSTTDQ